MKYDLICKGAFNTYLAPGKNVSLLILVFRIDEKMVLVKDKGLRDCNRFVNLFSKSV
jgi:hypothetical protein